MKNPAFILPLALAVFLPITACSEDKPATKASVEAVSEAPAETTSEESSGPASKELPETAAESSDKFAPLALDDPFYSSHNDCLEYFRRTKDKGSFGWKRLGCISLDQSPGTVRDVLEALNYPEGRVLKANGWDKSMLDRMWPANVFIRTY